MAGGSYPSLAILAWMAVVSAVIPFHGRAESACVLASVATSAAAMMSQAWSMEAGLRGKSGKDVLLQVLALSAFSARMAAFGLAALR